MIHRAVPAPATGGTRDVPRSPPGRVRQAVRRPARPGARPRELGDFAGQTSFVLDLDREEYDVRGDGVEVEGLVRVFEKDDDGQGKDIRVWAVRLGPVGFTAEHAVS